MLDQRVQGSDMNQEQQDRNLRYQRDFFTNPTFDEVIVLLREMEQKEVVSVRGAGQGGDISKVNYHTGIAEGVRRAILRLENEAGAAMGLHDGDGVTQEQLEEMMA